MNATATNVGAWNHLHTLRRHHLNYPAEPVVRFIHNLAEAGGTKALDVGCGAGRHMRLMADLGIEPYGVDFSDEALQQAGQHGTVERADMAALPYQDGTFDAAVAFGVLYYGTKADTLAALLEIRRVLKDDGHALITLRTPQDWRYQHGEETADRTIVFTMANEPEDGMTMNFTNPGDLTRLLKHFKAAEVDLLEETRGGTGRRNSDWLVVVRK